MGIRTLAEPFPEGLLARVRAEYREMPGLQLTLAQACRLWQIEPATCEHVLVTLVGEGFLGVRADGRFVSRSAVSEQWSPLKVELPRIERRRQA